MESLNQMLVYIIGLWCITTIQCESIDQKNKVPRLEMEPQLMPQMDDLSWTVLALVLSQILNLIIWICRLSSSPPDPNYNLRKRSKKHSTLSEI